MYSTYRYQVPAGTRLRVSLSEASCSIGSTGMAWVIRYLVLVPYYRLPTTGRKARESAVLLL
jgi:hypothetical protein